jgi:hypothetical protein
MPKKASTQLIGRSAINGRFLPVKTAQAHPRTTVVERIKTTKKK